MQPYLLANHDQRDQDADNPTSWRLLYFLNAYRLGLSGLLIGLYFTDHLFTPLASQNKTLFVYSSIFYFLCGLVFARLIQEQRPRLTVQVYSNIVLDIVAIILLVHASGGIDSGLSSLMVLPIACGCILLRGRATLLPAAFASISVLMEQGMSQFNLTSVEPHFIKAGILGITYFATTGLVVLLSRRIRESEALATKRGIDLANMAELTEHIIQRMQTGIIVIDGDNDIRLINEAAWHMLGMPSTRKSSQLDKISAELSRQILRWKANPDLLPQVIRPTETHVDIMPRFSQIGANADQGVLIYLEDTSALTQQAQQLQLASLGRLTASIAHEIRNPLGAISHAGQLLTESPNLDHHDKRLTQIIADHTQRLNTIVTNIMQISRRNSSYVERFSLKPFIERCIVEYQTGQSLDKKAIRVDIQPPDVEVRFDPSHLQQILVNLCDNGLRHSQAGPDQVQIELRGGITPEFKRPFLDIVDHGPGIDSHDAPHIFEPFFTTSPTGTGLGLYISRQLAECNQAHLNYLVIPTGGACFRITFQDPRRNIY